MNFILALRLELLKEVERLQVTIYILPYKFNVHLSVSCTGESQCAGRCGIHV